MQTKTERDEQCSHVATLRVTVSELQVIRNYMIMFDYCQFCGYRLYAQFWSLLLYILMLQTELHSLRDASEKLQILEQRMASTEDQLAKVKAALLRSAETLVRERLEYAALQVRILLFLY